MEQALLTPAQETAIRAVAAEPLLAQFYLTGGTALAVYHLGHRISDDLDFFIFEKKPDPVFLHGCVKTLKEILGATRVRFERLYDRYQFFFTLEHEELKIEFTHYPFRQLESPFERDGIRIDGLRDIAANKLMALLDRFDPKDFVDLFFLLKERALNEVRRDAEKKFGNTITPVFLGGELAKVRRIEALPKMLKSLTIEELRTFFAEQARTLAPEILQ